MELISRITQGTRVVKYDAYYREKKHIFLLEVLLHCKLRRINPPYHS